MSFSLRGQVGPVSLAACIVLNSSPATSASLPALKIDPALLGTGTVPTRAEAVMPTSATPTPRPSTTQSATVQAPPVATIAAPAPPPPQVETPKASVASDVSVGAGNTPSPTPPAAAVKVPPALIESPTAKTAKGVQDNSTVNNADPTTRIVADRISGTSDTQTRAEGHVELRKLDMRLTADQVTHTQADDEVDASGAVLFTRPNEEISGPHLRLKLTDNLGFFENPAYKISSTRKRHLASGTSRDQNPVAHGSATRMDFVGEGKYQLTDATYSTCKPSANGDTDWFAKAGSLNFDQNADTGTGRNATVYFKGIPIFFTPWLSFSLSNQRQSGLLTPTFGSTSKSGIEFTQPIYWNIAPDMDATFSPRLMSKRGVQMNSEFRYLDPKYAGQARYEYLPNDKLADSTRHAFALTHTQQFGGGFSGSLNLNGVSDDTYFTDLSSRLAVTSQTNLLRQGVLSYGRSWWSATLMTQTFQTLQDPLLPPVSKPYKLLPRLSVTAARADLPLGAVFSFDGESTMFRHESLVEGSRFSLYPQLALPMQISGLSITPKIGLHATKYRLDNPPPGTPERLTRNLPIASLDSAMVFERDITWTDKALIQTLEPRVYYLYIPNRDQSKIPVFDTGIADLNFSQMFAENRYAGGDRIGDANQLTYLLSSRLIDPTDGTEVVRGSFGQRMYFTSQKVGLPGEALRTDRQTDLLAEVSGQILPHTTATTAWQYNPHLSKTERFNVSARYQPELGKILNASYRFTHAATGAIQPGVSQMDFSGQWPLAGKWQAVGRYNYSFREKRVVETLAGLEYGEDCWAARFVLQRLATQTQESTTALFLQLELNGFSRIGSNPLETLKRSIPGYGIINQPSADPAFAAN